MNRKFLLVITVIMSVLLITFGFSGCSKSESADDGITFTWWNGNGEDTSYYDDYSKNPAVNYITTQKTWGPNEVKINIDFTIPPAGTQLDNVVTMISTGDYTDIVDMSYYSNAGSVLELYEDGICMDLTPYVEQYMPNYLAFLEAHPDYALTATNVVDGEKKYLQLYNYHDTINQWGGWQYRRDWLVKYGTNPETGAAFTGGYATTGDVESWTDDVVFPSGGTDPMYISDWEWMMKIFETALEEEGIDDGYCISLPYQGHNETGDLVSAFGGSTSVWYINGDTVEFGGDSENFRVYLQAMKTWYDNGWVDEAFAEHTSDIFFRIDSTKVHQGKVGIFYEAQGTLGSLLDISNGEANNSEIGYTNGIMVFGARPPINDIYGTSAQQGVTPYCNYQVSLEYNSYIITDKAAEKDLEALFSMLDYMYGEEGGVLNAFGLSKEQYEQTNDEFYTKFGLTEGAYTVVETDGVKQYKLVEALASDTFLNNASKGNRFVGVWLDSRAYPTENSIVQHAKSEWTVYTSTGAFKGSFNSQRSAEDNNKYTKTLGNVREFMSKNIPGFINGGKDPFSDDDWNAYVNAVNKYGPHNNVDIMQKVYDSLK